MAMKSTEKNTEKKTAKSKRSTTMAASTTPKAAAKTAPKPVVVSTKPEPAKLAGDMQDPLTKKELVERMVRDTGMKKGDARRALEATMTVIAGALNEGRDLAVAPLGKIRIARKKETPNGTLVVLRAKLKDHTTPKPGGGPKDPLAEAAE